MRKSEEDLHPGSDDDDDTEIVFQYLFSQYILTVETLWHRQKK